MELLLNPGVRCHHSIKANDFRKTAPSECPGLFMAAGSGNRLLASAPMEELKESPPLPSISWVCVDRSFLLLLYPLSLYSQSAQLQ